MMIDLYEQLALCMSLDETSVPAEISKCFANVAELLINGYILSLNEEQYRITAVEFYYFNQLHLDFYTCLLNKGISLASYYHSSGITITFTRKSLRRYICNPYEKLEENTFFGYALITDVALINEITGELEDSISLKGMFRCEPYERAYEMIQNNKLLKFNLIQKPRSSDVVKFDDVYDCVRNIRKNVRTGIYSREEIATALYNFSCKRYRYEIYTCKRD